MAWGFREFGWFAYTQEWIPLGTPFTGTEAQARGLYRVAQEAAQGRRWENRRLYLLRAGVVMSSCLVNPCPPLTVMAHDKWERNIPLFCTGKNAYI